MNKQFPLTQTFGPSISLNLPPTWKRSTTNLETDPCGVHLHFGVPHPPTVETGRDLDSRPEPGECPRARPVSVRAYPAAQPFRRHENSRFLRILTDYRLSPFFGLDTNMEKHHKVCHPTSRVTNSLKHCPQVDQQSHPRHSTAFGSSSAGVFSCSMSVSANGALRLKLPVAPWKKTAAPSNLSGGTSSKKTIRWAPPAILCSSG